LVNDVRDRGQGERMTAVATDAGCHACHTHMSCTQFCPKQIAPTYSIAGLKRAVMKRALHFTSPLGGEVDACSASGEGDHVDR
jgi:fumarate reductase iron-sulfur subunit